MISVVSFNVQARGQEQGSSICPSSSRHLLTPSWQMFTFLVGFTHFISQMVSHSRAKTDKSLLPGKCYSFRPIPSPHTRRQPRSSSTLLGIHTSPIQVGLSSVRSHTSAVHSPKPREDRLSPPRGSPECAAPGREAGLRVTFLFTPGTRRWTCEQIFDSLMSRISSPFQTSLTKFKNYLYSSQSSLYYSIVA